MQDFDWLALFSKSVVFSRLSEPEANKLILASKALRYREGDVIIEEGERSEQLYIIGEGGVSVMLAGVTQGLLPVDSLSPGDFFGEMAWIEKKPRMATIVAKGECHLLRVSATEFQNLLNSNALFSSRVSMMLSERLRKLTEEVLSVNLKNMDEKLTLSNTKLDASLKAVESQMKAADTVLSQTSNRATDVINSYDRMRSQIVTIGAVVSLLFSLFLGAMAFFGWNKWNDFNETVKEVQDNAVLVTNSVKDAENASIVIVSNLDESNLMVETIRARIKEIENNVRKGEGAAAGVDWLFLEAIANLKRQINVYSTIAKYHLEDIILNEDQSAYQGLLEFTEPSVSSQFFTLAFDMLARQKQDPALIPALTVMIERSLMDDRLLNDQQKALSHYFLVTAALIEGTPEKYKQARNETISFINYMKTTPDMPAHLSPSQWLRPYLDSTNDRQAWQKVEYLEDVWRQLTASPK